LAEGEKPEKKLWCDELDTCDTTNNLNEKNCGECPCSRVVFDTGDFYFPNFEHTSSNELAQKEMELRSVAQAIRAKADEVEHEADERLWELNYRKHVKVLKPLSDRETELHRIINDPDTKKTALKKAERESAKIYDVIWRLMKYGRDVDVKK
jgi:uncharacterized Zn finger protein (UPF0148 family)